MLDGGATGEASHRFDADDGMAIFKGNPVTPILRFMGGIEFLAAQRIDDLPDRAWAGVFGELDKRFHGNGHHR